MWMEGNRIGDSDREEIKALVTKYRSFFKLFKEQTETFPNIGRCQEDTEDINHLFIKLPDELSIIDSEGIPPAIRRMCMQDLIDRARFLTDIRPASKSHVRVVAEISIPQLSNSGIIICSDYACVNDLILGDESGKQPSCNASCADTASCCCASPNTANSCHTGSGTAGQNAAVNITKQPLPASRSLEKEWTVCIPDSFAVQGAVEEIIENECAYQREFWYVGELE
jgi:hypothetical protein